MTFSGVLSAFFRFAIALVSFRLGPSGSLRAAISMSVSSIKASKSICSDSRIGCIDVRLLAVRNLCRGVHSSSVSSPSVDQRRQRYRDDTETYRARIPAARFNAYPKADRRPTSFVYAPGCRHFLYWSLRCVRSGWTCYRLRIRLWNHLRKDYRFAIEDPLAWPVDYPE